MYREMPLFSRKKDKKKIDQPAVNGNGPSKPRWEDSWQRTRVDPEEVVELLHGCTAEIKSRGMFDAGEHSTDLGIH